MELISIGHTVRRCTRIYLEEAAMLWRRHLVKGPLKDVERSRVEVKAPGYIFTILLLLDNPLSDGLLAYNSLVIDK